MDIVSSRSWSLPFLESTRIKEGKQAKPLSGKWALIVLNQPFSRELLDLVWHACSYRVFADGGSNRVYDIIGDDWKHYRPNLIVGDLDSIRTDVQQAYVNEGIQFVKDENLYETDFMKAVQAIQGLESRDSEEYTVIVLGGLTGRLDQTISTMSYLHKLRKLRKQMFIITDDNVGWVLDSGEHNISLDRTFLGPTCGLLPVGVSKTILSMKGLEWDWTDHESSFDGDVSTSNWLASDHIWIETTEPIWWTMELRLPSNK